MQLVRGPQLIRPMASPMPRRTPPMFFFCIGAAKCGTSWLYDYLRAHPECHLRAHKELHYFDTIEQERLKDAIPRMEDRIASAEAKLGRLEPAKRAAQVADILDYRDYLRVLKTCHMDKDAYFRYMMTGLQTQKLVADITPDYANLSVDMLKKVVGVANETRFLYVMRDPVARLWSHVRMDAKTAMPAGADIQGEARAILGRILADQEPVISAHSDYARVLSRIEAAIPPERRLIMFYEDLMTPAGIRTLCRFLRIKPVKADFEKQVLLGRSASMTQEERAAVRRLMLPNYEAVASRFKVLPTAWRKTMAEGFA